MLPLRILMAAVFAATVPAFADDGHATHSNSSGYISGCATVQTITITNSFEYPTNNMLRPLSLLWMPKVPAGWSLLTNTWGDGGPEANTNDFEIVFKGSLAANPIVFYYQVSVPTNEMGVKSLSADVEYQFLGDDDPTQIAAEPNPLPLPMLLTIGGSFTASNKVYDASTAASISNNSLTLVGTNGTDDVSLTAAAVFTDKHVGASKTVSLTGSSLSGTNAGNYTLSLTGAPTATADITQRDITVTAANNVKVYDGTTSATGMPTITSGSLAGSDTASWSEAYTNKDVGTGKTLTPAGTVNDGNSGNNYNVTFTPVATGVITTKEVTITANSTNKIYGTELTFSGTEFTASGLIGGDTVTNVTLTSAGSAVSATPGVYVISAANAQGAGLTNYAISYINGTLTVDKATATVTLGGLSQIYDGTAKPVTVATVPAGLTVVVTYDGNAWAPTNVGTYAVTGLVNETLYEGSTNGTLTINPNALPAPTGLTASKGTHTDKVALSWTASAGAVGYEVWRNTSSDTGTAAKISSPDVTGASYNDTDATNAVLYTYWVKTKGASGVVSAFSASDTGWRGLLSPSVSASKGLRREVSVTWSVSPGATSYELWKNTVNESSSAKLLASGSATLYRDMQVIPRSRYYYWVKALCTLGDSGLGTSSEGWCNGGGGKWDFNGDGRAEVWYYHEASGRWYVKMTDVISTTVLGGAGWKAVPADYDGDGKTDPAVYNRGDPSTGSGLGGTWKAFLSGHEYELAILTGFGGAGYMAAVGDYDGDGKADPAIYAESSGTWQVLMSANRYQVVAASGFGAPGYQAVPMDYDGDGKTDPAVYEEASGNWFMALSGNNYQISYVLQFGMSGYVPVPGEYEGLGYAQIAVYHEASGYWFIRTGSGDLKVVYFGMTGYMPMPADYDGDKHDDQCVFYRNRYDAIWYLLMSTEGFKMISGRHSRP